MQIAGSGQPTYFGGPVYRFAESGNRHNDTGQNLENHESVSTINGAGAEAIPQISGHVEYRSDRRFRAAVNVWERSCRYQLDRSGL